MESGRSGNTGPQGTGETISPDKLSLGSHTLKIRLAGHEETATTWRISVSPSLIFYIETLLAVLLVFFRMVCQGSQRQTHTLQESSGT